MPQNQEQVKLDLPDQDPKKIEDRLTLCYFEYTLKKVPTLKQKAAFSKKNKAVRKEG